MPVPNDLLDRAEYMLRYASEAVELTQTRSVQDLETDRTLELALAHLIQHVGELAGSDSERPEPATELLTSRRTDCTAYETR